MDMLQGAAQTRAKRAAAKRQAQADYLEASDRGAKNATAEAVLNLGAPGVAETGGTTANALPLTPAEAEQTAAVVQEGDQLGQKAARLQAGVKQGRISSAQYEIMIEQDMRSLMTKFPDSKFVILEQMSKYVNDSPGMSEYRAAKAELENQTTAREKREEDAINVAITHGGLDPNTPREDLVTRGYQIQSTEYAAEQARAIADFQTRQAAGNVTQLKAVNDARDDAMVKYVHGALTPVIQGAMDQFTTIMTDKSIPDSQKMQAASDFVNVYKPKAYELIEQNLTIAMNKYGMSPESADKERTRLRAQVDDIATQFSSDNAVNQFAIKGKILQTMKDSMGLDALDAMPVLKQFQNALGTPESVQALVDQIASDPGLQKVFTQELKGFQGLTQGDQTIRLKNLLAFTTDRNTSLRDYTPQESATIIKDSANLLNKGLYEHAISGDTSAQTTVLNTLGKVANAAIDLNEGSSTRALINSVNFLANDSAFKTIARLNPETKEFGALVGDEMRAATGKALISLMAKGQRDPYFKWQINDQTHRFELVPNGKAPPHQSANFIVGGLGVTTSGPTVVDKPQPSIEARAQVAAMNKAASFLMASTPLEDNPAIKGATFTEKWRFYTRGEMPESARQTEGKPSINGRERVSRLQNYWANVKVDWSKVPQVSVDGEIERTTGVSVGDKGQRSTTDNNGKTVTVPSFSEMQTKFSDNPIFQAVVQGAQDMGIPTEIAARLAHVEGRFKPQSGSNGAGAYGPMQVVAKLHNDESVRMFGKKVPDLTPVENVRLGLTILMNNYKRHGSWLEAAHDYIGRGERDANMSSENYAQLIAGE
jgi:hypothetical protein